MSAAAVFTGFDAIEHAYWIDGQRVPSITQLLKRAGLVDAEWFTEESRERGREVHALCADFDLGALSVVECESRHRAYLLAYAAASRVLRWTWDLVEEPLVSRRLWIGGTPDRAGRVTALGADRAILEIKSGAPCSSHAVQTALQAMLVADLEGVAAPEAWSRYTLYLSATGRFKLEEHVDRRNDFAAARRLLRLARAS